MKRETLLKRVRRARSDLDRLLRRLNADALNAPGDDGWTIKDSLAHLAAWERRLVAWLDADAAGQPVERPEPGLTWDDLDRLNERDFRRGRDRGLTDVLAESASAHQAVLAWLERLSDADLTDPARFAWMNGRPLWIAVRANTYGHYDEHLATIRAGHRGRSALT